MTFQDLITQQTDPLQTSLLCFWPELVLCGTIVVILLVRVFNWGQKVDVSFLVVAGSALGLWYLLPQISLGNIVLERPHEIFSGLLIYDSLSIFIRALLMLFLILFVILTKITGITNQEDAPDFYVLVLGATLGMCIMATANHLLTVFLGVEMASVPSYVLAGIMKGRARSSEASLKYAVYGAGTAGVMLYGISLLSGVLGTAHLPTMAQQLASMDIPTRMAQGIGTESIMVLALGGMMVMVGLAFKLSAVPFHFWCPDVFEGATAEVNAFLSVASKAAALVLLVRVAIGFGYVPDRPTYGMFNVADTEAVVAESSDSKTAATAVPYPSEAQSGLAVPQPEPAPVAIDYPVGTRSAFAALSPVRHYMALLLAAIAAITCTFGNLAAYGQTNIKRLLAYSTIAHAGYMIMPVAAALLLAERNPDLSQEAVSSLLFYVSVYLFMNLGAFAIVAVMRDVLGSEEIEDYSGLIHACPVTVVCFSILLFSLVGLPPLAGFWGKAWIFLALVTAGGPVMYGLLAIAGLNTAISLVYYLRVAKVMTMNSEPDSRLPVTLRFLPAAYVVAVSIPVLYLGIWPEEVYSWARIATSHLFL